MGGIQFCLTTGILSKLRRSERACYLLAPDICCRDMISSIKKPGHQSVLIQLHPRAGLWRPGSLHSPDCTRHQHLQPRLASPLPGKTKQSKSPQQDPLAHLFSDLLAAPLMLVLSSPSTLLLSSTSVAQVKRSWPRLGFSGESWGRRNWEIATSLLGKVTCYSIVRITEYSGMSSNYTTPCHGQSVSIGR